MDFHSKPSTFVSHVNIKVEDLNKSLQFYQHIMGFHILDRTSSTARLTTDGKTSILSLEQPEDVLPKQSRTTGLYHFALLLPQRKDLANIVLHFADNDIRFGASDHLVSEALYLHDPDGNEIEVYIDRDPSEWKWDGEEVAMAVDPLDFERLLKNTVPGGAWEGLPEETLMGHVHLHVSELEKTEAFYVNGLGLDVVNRFGNQALFLSYGKYHHHIGVNTWNGVGALKPAENSVGMESYSLIFPDEEAVQTTIVNLHDIGASVTVENGRRITYDPSGNRIELTV